MTEWLIMNQSLTDSVSRYKAALAAKNAKQKKRRTGYVHNNQGCMLGGLRLGMVGPSYPIPITVNRERDVVRKSPKFPYICF